jgi:hypothetical protein
MLEIFLYGTDIIILCTAKQNINIRSNIISFTLDTEGYACPGEGRERVLRFTVKHFLVC